MVRATRLALRLQTAARAAQRLELATARAAANGSLLQRAYTSQALRNAKPTIAVRTMTTTATQLGDDQSQQKKQDPFSSPETQILEHALNHVAEFGWSVDALAAGAKDIGYPSVAHGMLPRGAIELVDFFMDRSFEQTRATLVTHTAQLQAMSVADRLKFGVRTRLELLAPVVHTWPQAMALGALPQNAPSTMRKLAQLADEIWYFAGDKSTDASWYTKRALLTGIYASTELFLLSDASPNFEETWKFLDRRIEETITLGELPRNLEDVAGMVNIGVQSFLSAAVSLAGPLGSQIVKSSPLGNVPNPISAIGNVVVPPSVAAGLASAGFPPNPLSGGATPSPFPTSGNDFEPTDLREIDQELEKLGGSDARRN